MNTEQEKILVVDDEEVVRQLLKRILEDCGYSVTTAVDGDEALYKIGTEEARVMLLDITMPKMSGIEVLKRLVERRPEYCVIIITAMADISLAVEAFKLGAYDYITKPFDQNDVKDKVQKAIQKWQNLTQEKKRYSKLSESFSNQSKLMQQQFNELVDSLAREHKTLYTVATRQPDGGKAMLSKLPEELRRPLSSIEEFRDALMRILKRS
jgi:DNA-binding NtrC family response regulator